MVMPATDQDIQDAQLQLLYAETHAMRETAARTVSELAVMILNDKHAGTGRNVDAAVAEALNVYKAVVKGLAEPGLYGPAPLPAA